MAAQLILLWFFCLVNCRKTSPTSIDLLSYIAPKHTYFHKLAHWMKKDLHFFHELALSGHSKTYPTYMNLLSDCSKTFCTCMNLSTRTTAQPILLTWTNRIGLQQNLSTYITNLAHWNCSKTFPTHMNLPSGTADKPMPLAWICPVGLQYNLSY